MASSGNTSSNSGSSAQRKVRARQAHLPRVRFGEFPAPQALSSGTGFETLPSLAISTNLLKFLKSMNLKSVGLGLENVPLHFGWNIVEWNPKLSQKPVDLWENLVKIVEICDDVEEEGPEVSGP